MRSHALMKELVGYAAASAAALAVDMGLLQALTSVLEWHYLPASAASFTAGGVVAYFLSVRLAFRFHKLASRNVELASFVALGLVGLLVNSLVMWSAVTRLGLPVIGSKSCAAVCTFTVNFLSRRQLLFASQHPPDVTVRVAE